MNDLQQYKKIWKEQPPPEYVDKQELSRIIKGKSSGIVKWIFIISILEFAFFIALDIFTKSGKDFPEEGSREMRIFSIIISTLSYLIMLFYIVKFYLNYRKISLTLTVKDLIQSIINTRRTVRQYITANIILLAAGTLSGTYIILQTEEYQQLLDNITQNSNLNGTVLAWSIIIALIVLAVAVLLLFYYLIYGLLIRKLMNNYKELTGQ